MTMKPLLAALALACGLAVAAPAGVNLHATESAAHARQAPVLAAAWAGPRAVAVGAHGIVLLSDDRGQTWRQARQQPVDVTLTGLSFADEREGWAVGHAGVVLHTADGGESWQLQRSATQEDRPLFAVHFSDREHGVAVGLWSLVLVTRDGGRSWAQQELAPPPGAKRADLNLLGLFAGSDGSLYAASEKGQLLQSADGGEHWRYLSTGYRGSFWTGAELADGVLLAAGLRGALYRSTDRGQSWGRVENASTAAITALVPTGGPGALAVTQDGTLLRSDDNGASFRATPRPDRARLAAALADARGPVLLFSNQGTLAPETR